MQHLTAAQVSGLKNGTLEGDELKAVNEHLAGCEECQVRADDSVPTTRVFDSNQPPAVRGETTEVVKNPERAASVDRLEAGAHVGRYVVNDVVGEGGMGVVYSAFDPELDRHVAIKLLQGRADGSSALSGGQAWLLREAQALARLSHPNVIAVHDVGTLPGERVFVAMELVKGKTLRQVLKTRPRWPEVVRLLGAAGDGLAAAHRAGLVHRDFKPDNVLVGDDGQVKVLDFGLARLEKHAHEAAQLRAQEAPVDVLVTPAHGALAAELTQAGQLIGTPAYMAPEIYDGADASAASDQFAFGVTLYQALTGSLPWAARPEQRPAGARWTPAPVDDPQVPPRLLQVALRCLAGAPAQRFPSMDEALAALRFDAAAQRQRRLLMAVAALVVVVVGGGAVAVATNNARRCAGFDRKLVDVWDDAVRARAEAAFAASKKTYAAATWAGIAAVLDAWSRDWVAMSTESCEATQVHGEQSEEVYALRQSCLEQRRDELQALTTLLSSADGAVVERADKAAFALAPVKLCADVAALQATVRLPTAPAQRDLIVKARQRLALAKAEFAAGVVDKAAEDAAAAGEAAAALPYAPWQAEALQVLGDLKKGAGKNDDAVAAYEDAAFKAVGSKRDDVAAAAALGAAEAAASKGDDKDARRWLGLGAALAERKGDAALRVRRLEAAGVVAAARGEFTAAAALHDEALNEAVVVVGADNAALWKNEQLLASSYAKAGAWAAAIPHYERALALKRRVTGDEHPDVASIFAGLGGCYTNIGAWDKAKDALSKALAVRVALFGSDSPKLVAPLNNLGDLLRQKGELDAALGTVERGVAIAEKTPGPAHPLTHTIQTTLGEVLTARGELVKARARFVATLSAEEAAKSPILPTTLTALAGLCRQEKKEKEAADVAARAIAALEASGGKDAADLWKPLWILGEAKLAQKQPAQAELTRSLAIAEKNGVAAADVDKIKAALAR